GVQDGLLDDLEADVVRLVAHGDDGPDGLGVAQRVGVGEASEDVLGGLARPAEDGGAGEADQYGARQHGAQPGVLPREAAPVRVVGEHDDAVARTGDAVVDPVLLVRRLGQLLRPAVPGGVVPARLLEHHQGDVGDVDGEVPAGLLDASRPVDLLLGGAEAAPDLLLQVDAVGDHDDLVPAQVRGAPQVADQEGHGEALAGALGVPDDAAALVDVLLRVEGPTALAER